MKTCEVTYSQEIHDGMFRLSPGRTLATDSPVWCKDVTQALETIFKPAVDNGALAQHRAFIIGGASIYNEALEAFDNQLYVVDRILLTRILSPSFDECNVFFPDFRSRDGRWTQCSHEELQKWAGFDVPAGIQEERDVKYEFQMWVRPRYVSDIALRAKSGSS